MFSFRNFLGLKSRSIFYAKSFCLHSTIADEAINRAFDIHSLTIETERKAQYLYSEQIEKYLDVGYRKCYLRKADTI